MREQAHCLLQAKPVKCEGILCSVCLTIKKSLKVGQMNKLDTRHLSTHLPAKQAPNSMVTPCWSRHG